MKSFFSILVLCSMFASCTSITRGTEDVLSIETSPSNAQVRLSNGMRCTSTPCALRMPRRSQVVLNITRTGGEPVIVNVTHRRSNAGAAGLAGNVLLGGLLGIVGGLGFFLDGVSGSPQDLVPNPVKVSMTCKD